MTHAAREGLVDATRLAGTVQDRSAPPGGLSLSVPVPVPEPAPGVVRASVAELVERARALAGRGGRRILGITGAPGAGKSTLARQLVEALGPDVAVLVPMDGFHLSNATLHGLGCRDRKGAWDTFDAGGYLHLLLRLGSCDEPVVYAPDFDRGIDESIGSALPVPSGIPLVVTEGNYLLSEQGSWGGVAELLDACWYLEIDDGLRRQRLVARHESHGKRHDEAVTWTHGSDEANAELVVHGRARADLVVTVEPTVTTPPTIRLPGVDGREMG